MSKNAVPTNPHFGLRNFPLHIRPGWITVEPSLRFPVSSEFVELMLFAVSTPPAESRRFDEGATWFGSWHAPRRRSRARRS